MNNPAYVTITGLKYRFGTNPISVDGAVMLEKEPDNAYDGEAIAVKVEPFGTVGYVANSVKTVIRGTMSAGRVYDRFDDKIAAKITFIFVPFDTAIAELDLDGEIDGSEFAD